MKLIACKNNNLINKMLFISSLILLLLKAANNIITIIIIYYLPFQSNRIKITLSPLKVQLERQTLNDDQKAKPSKIIRVPIE